MDKNFLEAITIKNDGRLLAIASTENKDRQGDSLKLSDWDFKHFMNNPVLQAGHDYRPQYTIGVAEDLKMEDGKVTFRPKFHKITKLAQEIGKMYEQGILTAWSVGFIPKENNFETKKNQLLEISAVAVPANPFALTSVKGLKDELENVDEGLIGEIKGWVDKTYSGEGEEEEAKEEEGVMEIKIWDETESSFRHRVKDPELFEQDSFRTINLKKDKPRVDSVMGKLKGDSAMTIQSLIFPKDDGWTETEAQKWVDEHPDLKAIGNEDVPSAPENVTSDKPVEDEKPEDTTEKTTGETNGHVHIANFNKDTGDGMTNEVENHAHQITNFTVQDSGEPVHTHSLGKEEKPENKMIPEKTFKTVNYRERWNKTLSKEFDIESVPSVARDSVYKLYTDYLECEVKKIFVSGMEIPSPMIGTYLSALKETMKKHELRDTRNYGWSGDEIPPISNVIKLNSKEEDDFLIYGTQFYRVDGKSVILSIQPNWSGLYVTFVSSSEDKNLCKSLQKEVDVYAFEHNKLKGEMFALSGEFIEKTDERFEDVILNDTIKKSVVNTASQLKKKGIDFPSRGMIFIGPPGTGKTKTCRALMNDAENVTFIWVSSKDLQAYSAVGGISLAYKLAREIAPAIVLFEDIDTWIKDYTVDVLKTELDGLKSNKAVLTILTSNNPEKLPDALIDRPGRFHEILEFALPDKSLRSEMLIKWIGSLMENVDEKNFNRIVDETDGMSGAHIKELVDFAMVMSEEESVSIDSALIKSLEKLRKQRELIGEIQKKSFEISAKEGRVLSQKNINIINQAITAQKNSVGVLEKLLEETTSTEGASKTQKAPINTDSNKGRAELQKQKEQKTSNRNLSDEIVLRVLQKIAGQSCYALNKLKKM